jgi:A/G-specific adenine glycosylase
MTPPSPNRRLADLAIRWFDRAARDLPWRRPGTSPWGVLVSEVMLQQTQVARVAPVYEEWLRRWPAPADLARATAGDAIRAWGRLGYPRRALRLHECALAVVDRHRGKVPDDLADLLALPGIGQYTARAVAAFAFGQRHPVVDTNVRRLVSRAHRGRPDAGPATTTADLALVAGLLPSAPARAALASAAFMEIGALVCTARSPACAVCPVAQVCAWRAAGSPAPEPTASRRAQRYTGTDRQARGVILELARRRGVVEPDDVAAAWPDVTQTARALGGLVADGLLVTLDTDRYALPGGAPTR